MNLTEATMLALQGKLEEKKSPFKKPFKKSKTESLNVSVDDGVTTVQDEEKTVIVADNTNVIVDEEPVTNTEKVIAEVPDIVEVPVESDETIIPEEEVSLETLPEETDLPVEDNENSDLEEPANLEDEDELDESKELKTETIEEGNSIFELKFDCSNEDNFGTGDAMINPLADILREVIEKIEIGTFNGPIMDVNGNKIGSYGIGYEGVQSGLEESKEIKTEDVEEEPADQIEDTEEVVEDEKPTADWSDNEIAEYIANHFKEVTGVELQEIFNQDTSEDSPIFNQDIIDATSDEIFNFIDNLGFDDRRKDDFVYILDDTLSSKRLNNSEDEEVVEDIVEEPKEDEEVVEESKEVCSDCGKEKCECKKEAKVFNAKSFNENLSKLLNNDSLKVSKVTKFMSNLKVEGKLNDKDFTLSLKKVKEGNLYEKYLLETSSEKLTEGKEIYMTTKLEEGTFKCCHIVCK